MIGAFLAMIAAPQNSEFTPPCSLPENAHFFTTMDVLPSSIRQDFLINAGRVANPGEAVNFSDMGSLDTPKAVWRYIGRIDNSWYISYKAGGITVRDITVGYELLPRSQFRYIGAVAGEICISIDYLRGKRDFTLLEGWRRQRSAQAQP